MTTQNKPQGDALREALAQKGMALAVANGWIPKSLPHDQYLSAWALMGEFVDALSHPPAPEQASGEQQAQAGEPEVVAHLYSTISGFTVGLIPGVHSEKVIDASKQAAVDCPSAHKFQDLITLQSHREVMAAMSATEACASIPAVMEYCQQQERAIAKKDAALQACVEAMEGNYTNLIEWANAMRAAITQAQEAKK